MLEGLWTLQFISNLKNEGSGVLIFKDNKVFGGDNQYYYLGQYEIKNEVLNGIIEIKSHIDNPISIFGSEKSFILTFNSPIKIIGGKLIISGHRTSNINSKISIELTKQNDLK
jgi:hypothetical protein